jgi:V8-like Glu-specific endopeptidase
LTTKEDVVMKKAISIFLVLVFVVLVGAVPAVANAFNFEEAVPASPSPPTAAARNIDPETFQRSGVYGHDPLTGDTTHTQIFSAESSISPALSDLLLSPRALQTFEFNPEEAVPVSPSLPSAATRNINPETIQRSGIYGHNPILGTSEYVGVAPARSQLSENSLSPFIPNGISVSDDVLPKGSRNIFWGDERIRINHTTAHPYNPVVRLLIVGGNGRSYIGSGFLIGPSAVATSGHCLFDPSTGGWARSVTVIPAGNGNSYPYGTAVGNYMWIGGNWGSMQLWSDDWGIIELNTPIGNRAGYVGIKWQSNSYNGTNVITPGYPGSVHGSVNNGFMYCGYDRITHSSGRTLEGYWSASGGNSGGPIMENHGNYFAIGIHHGTSFSWGGEKPESLAVRIDQYLFDLFSAHR